MNKFLNSNDWKYRLARTIVQGFLGVVIANVDIIAGYVILDPTQRALAVALVMAVLSPIMAMLGGDGGWVPSGPEYDAEPEEEPEGDEDMDMEEPEDGWEGGEHAA